METQQPLGGDPQSEHSVFRALGFLRSQESSFKVALEATDELQRLYNSTAVAPLEEPARSLANESFSVLQRLYEYIEQYGRVNTKPSKSLRESIFEIEGQNITIEMESDDTRKGIRSCTVRFGQTPSHLSITKRHMHISTFGEYPKDPNNQGLEQFAFAIQGGGIHKEYKGTQAYLAAPYLGISLNHYDGEQEPVPEIEIIAIGPNSTQVDKVVNNASSIAQQFEVARDELAAVTFI